MPVQCDSRTAEHGDWSQAYLLMHGHITNALQATRILPSTSIEGLPAESATPRVIHETFELA